MVKIPFWIYDPEIFEKPDLDFICNLLRSDEPLDKYVREWLANLLDKNATGKWRAELKLKNTDGGRPSEFNLSCQIAEYVDGGGYEREFKIPRGKKILIKVKIIEAMKKFCLGSDSIKKHRTTYNKAMDAYYEDQHQLQQEYYDRMRNGE